MIKTIILTLFFPLTVFFSFSIGPEQSNRDERQQNENIIKDDSIQLTVLVRQVYKWHMTNRLIDFPYKYKGPSDSIFVGIDWETYNKNLENFKKTNFFTDQFISAHNHIALSIDSSIKKVDIKWRNINDGIPIWDNDADYWCGCQDYPDNFWDMLTLTDIKIENNIASFYWTWDNIPNFDSHKFKMTAKKIGNRWKIDSLEGFKYYGSVAHYDSIIKDLK